ncbi:hypothetical protein ACFL4S_01025 [bacterium]
MRNKDLITLLGFAGTLLFIILAVSRERKKPSIERLRRAYAGLDIDQE